MRCNLGTLERGIRVVLGGLLIAFAYGAALPSWGAMVVYLLGAVALITGAVGFCPAWKLMGVNTCGRKPA